MRWFLLMVLFVGLLVVSCQTDMGPLQRTESSIIYGTDDRKEAVNHPDATLQKLTEAVALIVTNTKVKTDDKGVVTLTTVTYDSRIKKDNKGVGMCAGERFGDQVTASGCTGFLIGKRLLMTAGHCVDDDLSMLEDAQDWCNRKRFVFRFQTKKDGTLEPLTTKDVFRCKRVLRAFNNYKDGDFAVVELDRDAPYTPLVPDYKPTLKKGDKIAVLGHPHGFPMKIADNATIGTITKPNYFSTNLDSFPGNSGSPVIALPSYKVIAVHVRGQRPNVTLDTKSKCYRWTVLPNKNSGQTENLLNNAMIPTCQNDTDCDEHHLCRNQQCIYKIQDAKLENLVFSQAMGKQGDVVTVTIDVVNEGEITSPKAMRIGLWWSQNKTICPRCKPCTNCLPDRLLDSQLVPVLKAGERKQLTFRFPVTPEFFAKNYIGLYLDDTKIWVENREDNNIAYQLFTTTPVTCQDGTTQPCYHRVAGCTPQSSGGWKCETPCATGTQTCTGGKWQPCTKAVYPSEEICDGKDNDCNGKIDETFVLKQTCQAGLGECQTQGQTVCDGKFTTMCKAANLPPSQHTETQTQTIKTKAETLTFAFAKIPTLQDPNAKIALSVRLNGDFGGTTEYVTVQVGTQKIADIGKARGWDCDTIHEQTVWVPASLMQQQTLTVLIKNSKDVEPRCSRKNEVTVSLKAYLRQELCDGKDNDCDGKIDNNAGTAETLSKPCQKGTCSGLIRCTNQQWQPCDAPNQCPGPEPMPEPISEPVTETPEDTETNNESVQDASLEKVTETLADAGAPEPTSKEEAVTEPKPKDEPVGSDVAQNETTQEALQEKKSVPEKAPTPEPKTSGDVSVDAPRPGNQGCQCQSTSQAPLGVGWMLLLFGCLLIQRRRI